MSVVWTWIASPSLLSFAAGHFATQSSFFSDREADDAPFRPFRLSSVEIPNINTYVLLYFLIVTLPSMVNRYVPIKEELGKAIKSLLVASIS